MITLLIIADDLTGAIDTGVKLAGQGITFVTHNLDVDIPSLQDDLKVLVIDTESRHLPAEEAAGRVTKIVSAARRGGVEYFYKKTDSTLRGNPGAELEAVLIASESERMAFIPAYPAAQRYTRKGFHYVGDELLHRTGFSEDPREPVLSSFVPDIITRQSGVNLAMVMLEEIRSGVVREFDAEIIIFDCETDSDLRRIAQLLRERNVLKVTAGSAGFAALLPDILHLPRAKGDAITARGPLLIVNGSLNSVSSAQVDCAAKRGVNTMTLSPALLSSDGQTEEMHKLCERLAAEARADSDVILRSRAEAPRKLTVEVAPGKRVTPGGAGPRMDIRAGASHTKVAERIGEIVSRVMERAGFRTLVVFGGDTLIGIMRAMSIAGIRPLTEIATGTVLSIAGRDPQLHLVTKAGGFGEVDVIPAIIRYIRKK